MEYLENVTRIAGWKIEYVKVDSWQDAEKALDEGKIDIFSPVQMDPERLEDYSFSAEPVCTGQVALMH